MPLRELPREDHIIYYDWKIGGFTVDEWLVHWTWKYLIDSIDLDEYIERIDYITCEMPGAMDSERWAELTDYLELLRKNDT